MDGTKTTTNWIIAGLVALVVIIGGGWLIARERSGAMLGDMASSTESTSTANANGTNPVTNTGKTTTGNTGKSSKTSATASADQTASAAGETVTVNDQPAGSSVVVADVNVTKPSFVAVRDTRGWYPGWQFVRSSQKDVTIPLRRNTEAGRTYEVVLFVDNGDGTFELHGGDMLVTGSEGAPVSSTFTAK